jgi:hypothetical protein
MRAGANLSKRAMLPPEASREVPVEATKDEPEVACRALDAAPRGHVFARVDVVGDGTAPRVIGVELIRTDALFLCRPASGQRTCPRHN